MSCPECDGEETYVEDEYYDKHWHILTMSCHDCCALFSEHYEFAQVEILTKGNV